MRNRLLGIAIGLVLGATILLMQAQRTAAPRWRLLPENTGAIETIALQYTSAAEKRSLPCYRAFLREIGPDVEVLAVCGNEADARRFEGIARGWELKRPERMRTVVVGAPITGWCKDRFVVAESSPSRLIHPPKDETGLQTRTNDALVAPTLARSYSERFRAEEVPLRFDAGDILAMRKYVIVSDVLWRKNGGPHDFEQTLQRMFCQRVIMLHDAPDHHIAMYAAPIDERTVVVGDPGMARKLWRGSMEEKLGHADFSDKATAPFERAAEQLESAGFRVIRAPLVYFAPRVYVTYTNGIFETRDGRHMAYIPWYGVPELDQAGKAAFEAAGCEVHPIPVGKLYRLRGTIGCLVNVLERRT